ncbi:DUF2142 domain-containing protein [Kitasatospora mediocidica]|uniref:DUF2142 domain-containing protein n=1 Tax=Kitasatospora mediocidica TaxID=58352 RepID=UPI00055C84A8|nr:DUF2142 domain-containing protein [Kitasatospora mediocidica]
MSFLLFFTLAGAWSLATPIAGSPDEPSHIVRAAAVVRGQINGPEVMERQSVGFIPTEFANSQFQLPAWYRELDGVHKCYQDQWNPASCAPKISSNPTIEPVTTAAGRYNPFYYLFVGWPSLIVLGPKTIYLMRLASAAFTAALLASAFVTASEWRRNARVVKIGVLVAATPMLLFLGGAVNPNGVESAAGLLAWTAILSALMEHRPELLRRRVIRATVAMVIVLEIRPLGPIWIAGAVLTGLMVVDRLALRSILRDVGVRISAGIGVVATGLALLWSHTHPDHSYIVLPEPLGTKRILHDTLIMQSDYYYGMIGNFGWLDTPSPFMTYLIWGGVLCTIGTLALMYGKLREIVAVLGTTLAVIVIPMVAMALEAGKLGLIWQGRYLLPLAVGLPLLTAMVISRRLPERSVPQLRLPLTVGIALAMAGTAAFYWAQRRNGIGNVMAQPILHMQWNPPFGWFTWTLVYLVASFALVWPLLGRTVRRVPGVPEAGTLPFDPGQALSGEFSSRIPVRP